MKPNIYDTAVIGAGAAGLMAAITAARAGAHPVLLEHMDQPARKILSTGNGKCNYTNLDQKLTNYYCEEPDFVQTVLAQFSYIDTIHFFEALGIRPLQKNGTCIYPESEQADSVRRVLLAEVERLHIPVLLQLDIQSVEKSKDKDSSVFIIHAKEQAIYSRACILASGGKAAKKTGSNGSGYHYAKKLGHRIIQPLPALTALQADYRQWKLPAGVRISCRASLFVDGKKEASEQGELQITDYGISGIVIFQFSRIVSRALAADRQVKVLLDFKSNMPAAELASYLYERFHSVYHRHKTVQECLIGFLPDKLIPIVLRRVSISPEKTCGSCSEKQAGQLAHILKTYEVRITGTKNFDAAQVTTGGVSVREIHPQTMESAIMPGLYFAGELVDVDAKCGGYNLQWAWSSGYAAGKAAAQGRTVPDVPDR